MSLGVVALILAAAGAGLLLWRMARGDGANVTLLKAVAILVVGAALFAAKLWPLALMTMIAAAAVTGIEVWRDRQIKAEDLARQTGPAPRLTMDAAEAASILGIAADAGVEDIRAAHRRLIAQLHPDKGGTDYLAAKINEARDLLLARQPAPQSQPEAPPQSPPESPPGPPAA